MKFTPLSLLQLPLLFITLNCTTTSASHKPPSNHPPQNPLAQIPSYQKAEKNIHLGIHLVQQATLSHDFKQKQTFYNLAIQKFQNAQLYLEQTQDAADPSQQPFLEQRLNQLQDFIIRCIKDRPLKIRESDTF